MQTLKNIEMGVKSLPTESAKDLWDQKDDFLIRSTELLHAINATLKQKMSFLFAYDNYALLQTLAFFAQERSALVRRYVFGLFGDIVDWLQLNHSMV